MAIAFYYGSGSPFGWKVWLVLIYNPGVGVWGNVEDITPADFETSRKTNALGGLLASQQVIPAMKKSRRGSIILIGATASRRGGAKTAAFAPAKAAQKKAWPNRWRATSGLRVSTSRWCSWMAWGTHHPPAR